MEVGLSGLQDGRMEIGVADKLSQLEMTLNRLSEALFTNKEGTSHNNNDREVTPRTNMDETNRGHHHPKLPS